MSFIKDDEKLLFELFKSLAADMDKRVKNAQLAPDANVNVEYKNYLNLSSKLVDGLQQNYFPAPADPNAAEVSAPAEADMKIYDMNSFGNFLQFIASKQIMVNGARVAYLHNENPPDKKKWLPVDAERSTIVETQNEQGDRSAVQGEYFVNRDLLSKYMSSLSEKISKEEPEVQKMMKTLLGGLIEKSNSLLGTKNTVDHVEQAKTSSYRSDEPLGYFPQVLDYKRYTEDGPVQLTWGDIQSAEAIRSWVSSKNISVNIPDRQGGPLGMNHPEFDFCVVARVLYGKATFLQSRSTSPEQTKKTADFAKKMSEVAGQLQGPDGKACGVGASQSATNQNGQGQGQNGQAGAAGSPQSINNVISNLPFAPGNIDFDRINRFFEAVAPLLTQSTPAMSRITETQGLMPKLSAYMTSGDRVFNLGMNINQFANMLKNREQRGRQVYPALSALNQILDSTRAVVDVFNSQYGNNLSSAQKAYVIGQIGRNANDSSIYRNNSDDLEEIRRSGTPVTQ